MREHFYGKPLVLGLLFGVLSGLGALVISILPVPGVILGMLAMSIIFALFALAYFYCIAKNSLHLWKSLLWVVACSPSFYLAFKTAESLEANLDPRGASLPLLFLTISIGGFVGGAVVALAFHFFIARITWRQWCLVLGGATIAALYFYVPAAFNVPLFIVWQTTVMLSLGYALWYNTHKKGAEISAHIEDPRA